MKRRYSKEVDIGGVIIGGANPIAIQSMTNTRTEDVYATVEQIHALEAAGCDIVRSTVPTIEAAAAFGKIKKQIGIPLVADIHFDYRLAIAAIENGADKIRINPGNIGSSDRVRAVVDCARDYGVPIRVGVNSGSLEKDIVEKNGRVTAEGLCESALRQAGIIRDMGYDEIVISIKATDVPMCIEAHEMISDKTELPLHVGITEAGTVYSGTIVSAAGIGAILSRGIGDTVRVSLTGDPIKEVMAAKKILSALNMGRKANRVISCPTCGRTKIDLIGLAERVEALSAKYDDLGLRIAVMGCVVNGPGEAKEADVGIAGGEGCGLLIKKGEVVGKVSEEDLLSALEYELMNWGKGDDKDVL